jgi:hypothetical protein
VSISETVPAESFVGTTPRRPRDRATVPILPAITPGQLWLAQLPERGQPPALVRHTLAGADVVIYDRALADEVARLLPLGSYAEPASTQDGAALRSVRFAREGWSVARLLPARLPQRDRTRRVQDVVDELAAIKVAGRLPVTILAEASDGIQERIEARFDDLAAIVASYPRDTLLAIVIDAFGGGVARLQAVAANGLAG